jgi:hypothetical protein
MYSELEYNRVLLLVSTSSLSNESNYKQNSVTLVLGVSVWRNSAPCTTHRCSQVNCEWPVFVRLKQTFVHASRLITSLCTKTFVSIQRASNPLIWFYFICNHGERWVCLIPGTCPGINFHLKVGTAAVPRWPVCFKNAPYRDTRVRSLQTFGHSSNIRSGLWNLH